MLPEGLVWLKVERGTKPTPYSLWFRTHPLSSGPRRRGVERPCLNSERGQSLVEAAFTISILAMTVIGIMQVGMALHSFDTVADAARDGARYAMVHGSSCTGCIATSSSIQTHVQNSGLLLPNVSTVNVTTTWPDTGSSCTPSSNPCNNKGNNVKVKVSYPFQMVIPFIPLRTLNLSSTSEMVISQ